MKRVLSLVTAVIMTVSLCAVPVYAQTYEEAAAAAENAEINYNRSVPLEVKGNKIVKQGTDEMVVLRGVNVPSMDWGMAENLYESMTMVYDCWGANLIRLPIHPKYWKDGSIWDGKNLTKEQYQKYIDDMVKAAQARGKYIILDCHRYVMPQQDDLDMLKELAVKYGNNSAVLFGLLNEPHDIKPTDIEKPTMEDQWEVWYNGGQIIVGGEEVTAIGHQQLLNEIRALGANNICIAGGLSWAFDISGLADGYNGRENGYRLIDTAEGHGVMYDSHAYPVKGTKSSWDTIIGPVRRVAPILIGEWGWDSSDNNISGGDCTSDIWMNQIMNWMDDTDNQYDGIPLNWTAWNLHMKSSPRMISSWDYKTTAYNGTYIKNRLQSYGNLPETQDGVYSTDFSTNDVFRGYKAPSGAASVSYSEANENIVVSHKPADWYATLNFPFDWDLNGIQTITMDISADTAETLNIGLYGSDMEEWTAPVKVDSTVKNITLSIDQLVRQGNQQTDGILNGAVSGIYIGSSTTETANNTKVVTMADEDNTAEYKINNYENGKVSVRKRTDAEDSASTVIVAFYDKNSVLTGISTANIRADEKGDEIIKAVNEPASYSCAEVFMWDSLNGMVPRCNPISNKVNITIDNIKIVKLAEPIYTATEYPHTDIGAESYIDVDNTDFASQSTTKGAASTSYFTCENAEVVGADGENTQAKYITYDRREGLYGGTVQFDLETVPSMDTKYFTISLKGSGTAQTINVNLGSEVSYNIALAEGDTDWHQYIFDISYGAQYPEDIAFVKLASNTKIESYFYADDFGFSKTKPERVIPNPEKTFIYDFATYNRNTAKYEAVISTMPGSNDDEIRAEKVDGGLDFETQALEITYSRNGNIPSKTMVVYSPSDFFKGNSNDDERTANRATLKADMEYMTDLVFYGKSTSDKNEKINVGVIDAANSMMTYTDTKEFTLTSQWQQFRVPFDEFKVLDGGSELDCSRVRGFVFSSAENSGEGSFMIDNITHTSVADIEWAEPTPTPPPTPKVVSTAEELTALTSSDSLIVLGDDIDLDTEGMQTKCAMRLDLNGHTLSSSANTAIDMRHNFTLVDTGETKGALKNTGAGYALKGSEKNITVSIDGAEIDSVGGQALMSTTQDVTINIKDAVINGNTYAINFANGTLNIENVITNNSEDYTGYALAVANSNVTINGGTFNYYGTVSSITLSGASTVTINDGIFTNSVNKRGAINTLKGFSGTLTINGGTFENTTASGYSILDGDEGTTETAPTINITGGIFKSIIAKTRDTSTTQMVITGGQFASDPTTTYENCVDIEKYSVTKVAEEKYVVTEKGAEPTPEPTPVEIVTTLDEFKTSIAKAGVITKLGADIDLESTGIKTYYPIYLDLNGHTLTSSAGTALELTKDFTLVDTGTTKGLFEITGNGIKCATKELTVNIDGAEIDATAQAILLTGADSTVNIKDAVINGGSYAVNSSNGTLNIENTVMNNKEDYTGYALSVSGGTATIEDSTFNYNGTANTVSLSGTSIVTINGGAFINSAKSKGAIEAGKYFAGTLTINGGMFKNNNDGGYSILDSNEGYRVTDSETGEIIASPVINITGGTFTSEIGRIKPNDTITEIVVSGGTFSFNPEVYVNTETHSVTRISDNTYSVTLKGEEPSPAPTEEPTPTPTVDPNATTSPTDEPTPTADPDVTTPPTEEPTPTPEGGEATPTPIPVPTEMPEGETIEISTPEELVAALTNGGTYKVADGVEELDCDSLTLSVRKSINIDFNGAKVINLVSNGFDIQGDLSVRFKNGTFVGTGTYVIKAMAKTTSLIILDNITTEGATNGIASGNSYCAIEINGGNLDGKTYGINCGMGNCIVNNAVTAGISIGNESTIEFNDTEITVAGTGITASGSASVMLDGCTVTGPNNGMSWKSSGTLDIKNSTVTSSANGKATISIENTPAIVNITNSQISNTNETANKAYIISTNATAADSKITIDGGTYTGVFSINSGNPAALVIKSGTFSTDPTPYVDESESTVKENGDDTYTVETIL